MKIIVKMTFDIDMERMDEDKETTDAFKDGSVTIDTLEVSAIDEEGEEIMNDETVEIIKEQVLLHLTGEEA
jgi:hypothetical protein